MKSNIISSRVSSTSPSLMSYSAELKGRAHMRFIRCTKYSYVYTSRDVLEICDGIISDFYPRLPHIDLEMATQ